MHDFVKACLIPIDQLPRIASVFQTSGFRCLKNSTKFICSGLVVSQTMQKQLKWLPGKVFSKFYFYFLFFNLQIWPAIWPANSTCRFNLLNRQPANCHVRCNISRKTCFLFTSLWLVVFITWWIITLLWPWPTASINIKPEGGGGGGGQMWGIWPLLPSPPTGIWLRICVPGWGRLLFLRGGMGPSHIVPCARLCVGHLGH